MIIKIFYFLLSGVLALRVISTLLLAYVFAWRHIRGGKSTERGFSIMPLPIFDIALCVSVVILSALTHSKSLILDVKFVVWLWPAVVIGSYIHFFVIVFLAGLASASQKRSRS